MKRYLHSIKAFTLGLIVLVPDVMHAACVADGSPGGSPLKELVCEAGFLVGRLIGIISGLAVLVFFWGLVKYIWNSGNEKSQADGKKIMVGGVIAITVLFSIFGIVKYLQTTFGINNVTSRPPPSVSF